MEHVNVVGKLDALDKKYCQLQKEHKEAGMKLDSANSTIHAHSEVVVRMEATINNAKKEKVSLFTMSYCVKCSWTFS